MLSRSLLFVLASVCISMLRAEAEVKLIYPVDGVDYEVVEVYERYAVVRSGETETKLVFDDKYPLRLEGEFKVDVEHGWPYTNYSVSKVPRPYSDYSKDEVQVKPSIRLKNVNQEYPWSDEKLENGIVLIGWVSPDGVELVKVGSVFRTSLWYDYVTPVNENGLEGYPMLWLLVDGELSPRDRVDPVEKASVGEMPLGDVSKVNHKLRDEDRNTALHCAALNGQVDIVKRLVDKNGKLAALKNADGNTALMLAAKNGRNRVVEILGNDEKLLGVKNRYGNTALSLAAENGHIDIVDFLAKKDASLKRAKGTGVRALSKSIDGNYEEVALSLLALGVPLREMKPEVARNVTFSKLLDGYPRLGFYLMDTLGISDFERKNGMNAFHAIAGYADVRLLEQMKGRGMDVSKVSDEGFLPMDFAIASGNVPAICWFVENGGDPNVESRKVDPVTHAVEKGRLESVVCLMNYGYDVNVEMKAGMTAMMKAVILGHIDIAEALVSAGGTWSFENKGFVTYCLIRAIEEDSVLLVKAAEEQGLEMDKLLFGQWSIASVAEFYGADSVKAVYDWTASDDEMSFVDVRRLDSPIKFVKRSKIDYPKSLSDKFGDLKVKVRVGVDAHGQLCLLDFDESLPEEIRRLLSSGMRKWRLESPIQSERVVSTYVAFEIPLKAKTLEELAYDLKDLSVKPMAVYQVAPVIPYAMQLDKISGWVDLEWVVGVDGKCHNVKVVQSTHSGFEAPVVEALKKARFTPGEFEGKPVNCRVTQRITINN